MSMKRCELSPYPAELAALLASFTGPSGERAGAALLEGRHRTFIDWIEGLPAPGSVGFSRESYAASEVLSKSDFLDLGVDRKAVALESFLEGEDRCLRTNNRLTRGRNDQLSFCSVSTAILLLQRKISSVLGEFSWDDVIQRCGFGPGAAVGVPRSKANATSKFGHLRPSTTEGCLGLSRTALSWFDLWGSHLRGGNGDFSVVPGNKIITVPKNYKTDRTIAIEPLMNSFFQKGIGSCIRRKLRTVGIDLRDQTVNQELARLGSLYGDLATVDLKAASDSLAYNVVHVLCPSDWVEAFMLVRSHSGVLPSGGLIRYQKFSSMGNGYTFELESLIFWAILSVCRDLVGEKGDTISVYGDDLICPSKWTDQALEMLAYFGFQPNEDKTFSTGPFRESCGSHFLNGIDITPLYVRKNVASLERHLWMANSVKRLASRWNSGGYSLDGRFRPFHEHLSRRLQKSVPLIPEGVGDGGLITDFDQATPSAVGSRKRTRFWEGWLTSAYSRVYYIREVGGMPRLVKNLHQLGKRGGDESPTWSIANIVGQAGWDDLMKEYLIKVALEQKTNSFPEGFLGRYMFKKAPLVVQQWWDLGPWE